jgi:hypothetical protein
MITIKTTELSGKALDYAVAICLGGTNFWYDTVATYWITIYGKSRAFSNSWGKASFAPSTNWDHAGPIIEQLIAQKCSLLTTKFDKPACFHWQTGKTYIGETILIAAMRCYVASKLGETVDIPNNLLSK